MKTYIFDLDGTIVDSSHRLKIFADGSVDLEYWRDHSTFREIMLDTLLPLAKVFKSLIGQSETQIIICTARPLKAADHAFLREKGLFCNYAYDRNDWVEALEGAPANKRRQVERIVADNPDSSFVFYEDNQRIRAEVAKIPGVECVDPSLYNDIAYPAIKAAR